MGKDFSYAKVLLQRIFVATVCAGAIQMSMAGGPQPAMQVLNSALPGGVNGLTYQSKLYAGGGVGPYTWALLPGSVLPTGTLFQFSSGGVLSGTPTTTGSYSIVVQATDANGKRASRSYTLTISNSGITTSSLPSGVKGVRYNAGGNRRRRSVFLDYHFGFDRKIAEWSIHEFFRNHIRDAKCRWIPGVHGSGNRFERFAFFPNARHQHSDAVNRIGIRIAYGHNRKILQGVTGSVGGGNRLTLGR
jgi:hypothetical protein